MPRIAEMFAFVTEDTGPEDEGIVAMGIGGMLMPLVGADLERTQSLMPHAQGIADQTGKQIRIYKFTGREQIGTIEPRTT